MPQKEEWMEWSREETGEKRVEVRQEQKGRPTTSKPPTPSPLTTEHKQGPPIAPYHVMSKNSLQIT
jgi:hypothetical protein